MQLSPRTVRTADRDPSDLPSLEHPLEQLSTVRLVRISKQGQTFEPDRSRRRESNSDVAHAHRETLRSKEKTIDPYQGHAINCPEARNLGACRVPFVRVERIFPAGGKRILVLFGQSLVEPVFSSESEPSPHYSTMKWNRKPKLFS